MNHASFCRPPESVSTWRASPVSSSISRYPTGSVRRMFLYPRSARACSASGRVRGWMGITTGSGRRSNASKIRTMASRPPSVVSARWSVARRYFPGRMPSRPKIAVLSGSFFAMPRKCSTASSITSPQTSTPRATPSFARFFAAVSVGQNSQVEIWSVSTRFCSSGMRML